MAAVASSGYPAGLNVDFRKHLSAESLVKVLKHYGVAAAPEKSQAELALLAARTFESHKLAAEVEVVDSFAAKYLHTAAESTQTGKKRTHTQSFYRDQLDNEPARVGEQVAAKVLQTNENGSWILANTLDYDPGTQTYELQDEDDANRIMQLGFNEVKRLEDTAAHLRRGDNVLAVFPETTSFYRAVVAKNPRPPQHGNSLWEVIVRFEDDEDDTGKSPARRVPARFILLRSDIGDEEDEFEDGPDEEEGAVVTAPKKAAPAVAPAAAAAAAAPAPQAAAAAVAPK
jgi:SAGA-associated factor 29